MCSKMDKPSRLGLRDALEVSDMTTLLPTSTSANGILSWLVGGMAAVVGFYLLESTLSPAVEDAIRNN